MESNEWWQSNFYSKQQQDSKTAKNKVNKTTQNDKWKLNPELELEFTSPKEQKSRNKKMKNCWNHKTAMPLGRGLESNWESVNLDHLFKGNKTDCSGKVLSAKRYNKWASNSNLAWSKLRSTNIFDSCLGSVRSNVPKHLISDANRRKQQEQKSGHK